MATRRIVSPRSATLVACASHSAVAIGRATTLHSGKRDRPCTNPDWLFAGLALPEPDTWLLKRYLGSWPYRPATPPGSFYRRARSRSLRQLAQWRSRP